MRTTVISVLAFGVVVGLVELPSQAQDRSEISRQQAQTMKRLIASGKSVPTGIDVPGPTYYQWNKAPGASRYFNHQTSTRDAKQFWDLNDHYGQGSNGGGANGP